MLTTVGKVAVLILVFVGSGVARSGQASETDLRVFEFTSTLFAPLGRCQLQGLMATDGARHRMALYWTEPGPMREDSTSFISYCDILLTEEGVHYWIHGMAQPGVERWSDHVDIPLLPHRDDTQSVIRSALAIVHYLRGTPEPEPFTQHLHCFLQDSRSHPQYTYEYTPDETDEIDLFSETATDRLIFNTLPLGRLYMKNALSNGTLLWDLRRALNNETIVRVAVKRKVNAQQVVGSSPFDAHTLGQWPLIPESYRFYWSCRSACSELTSSADPNVQASGICGRIESYLDTRQMPDRVRRALERLWFDTALSAGDARRVRQSLQVVVSGFCRDEAVSNGQALVELGRIAENLESRYPRRFRAMLAPRIEQMVEHAGEGILEAFSQHMRLLSVNKWFSYGDMLLETVRRQGYGRGDAVNALAVNFKAERLAYEIKPFDPSKAIATVKLYLTLLHEDPPPGTLTIDDVRCILEKGLAGRRPAEDPGVNGATIENVIKSLRLIAGEGPFRGDRAKLVESIERFATTYLDVCRNKEPIGPALATFLALSFHDISTPRDHELLCGQVSKLSTRLQSQVNTMLAARALHVLVSPEDVRGIFDRYCEEEFRRYVDDPFCAAFKLPLTANEELRLASKLVLRLNRIEPLFEEMSLKVKYGGVSAELKEAMDLHISRTARYLLSSTAFLRRPSYAGVSCHYRGGNGFATVIPETIYQDDRRAREGFRAMRYFHLGHRLQSD